MNQRNEARNVVFGRRGGVDIDLIRLSVLTMLAIWKPQVAHTLLLEKSSFTPLSDLECAMVL